MDFKNRMDIQRQFLVEGNLMDIKNRIKYLKIIRTNIIKNKEEIINAISKDLGKVNYEIYLTEYQVVLGELEFFIENLYDLTKIENKGISIGTFPGYAYIIRKPYGQVLIQSPWNYPFQLAFSPLIGAISGGNTVVLKTSRKVPKTNEIIDNILNYLPKELVIFAKEQKNITKRSSK